jgi:hypothetical protein
MFLRVETFRPYIDQRLILLDGPGGSAILSFFERPVTSQKRIAFVSNSSGTVERRSVEIYVTVQLVVGSRRERAERVRNPAASQLPLPAMSFARHRRWTVPSTVFVRPNVNTRSRRTERTVELHQNVAVMPCRGYPRRFLNQFHYKRSVERSLNQRHCS